MIFSDKSSLFDFELLTFLHNTFKYNGQEGITYSVCNNEDLEYLNKRGINNKVKII
jgi:hypothetical protein